MARLRFPARRGWDPLEGYPVDETAQQDFVTRRHHSLAACIAIAKRPYPDSRTRGGCRFDAFSQRGSAVPALPLPVAIAALGSLWQCRWSSWQWFPPHDRRMTNATISRSSVRADDARWRSIAADLTFWTAVGAVVATFSGQLANWWNVPRSGLLVGGLAFLVAGVVLLFGLNRIRPTSGGLVLAFGVSNLLLAPTLFAAALLGWLPLSTAGNWALAGAGDAALVLGIWQLTTLRRRD
jgi:hypothetical protein